MLLVLMCVSSLVVPVQAASFMRLQGGAATASARGLPTSVSVSTTRQNDNATSEQYALGALPEEIPEDARVTPVWAAALPTHFDWRENGGYNYLTSVKNQGGCGSCVAFAAVGTVEAQYKITYSNPSWNLDLSEQHLFTCGGGQCGYGWYISVALNRLRDCGTPDEACYPYQGRDASCSGGCADWQSRAYKIVSWNWIANNPGAIEAALMNGPVIAAFTVYSDFYNYHGGIYQHTSGNVVGGHAVTIVGYDSNEQYWIVKNSWSANWGENGYFRIGFREAGIENYVASVNVVAPSLPRTVTFYTNPEQATVSADGAIMINGATATYSTGQSVHVVANPPQGYSFSTWEVNGGSVGNQLSPDTYMTVSGDGQLKANFNAQANVRAGVSQPYVLGFKVSDVYSDSHTGDFSILTTDWSSSGAEFQVTLAQGESLFLVGTAQVWNDYVNVGSSIAICRDGVRISGDMFAAGATITNRELATAVAVDTPDAGTYAYSLSAKTDPGGTARGSEAYILAFKVSDVHSQSRTGDFYVSTTRWSSTGTEFQVTLGAGESLFLIGTAQVWNDYQTIGSSIAVCRDGARASGDMFAAGATITYRELATAVALETPGAGTSTYMLSGKTD